MSSADRSEEPCRFPASIEPTATRAGAVREDVHVSDLRIERFSDPSYLARVGPGEAVPGSGWAIRSDGQVYLDGVQVGHSGKYVFDRLSGTPYAQISFEALDPGAP
jgi:hypothetical protein